MTLKMFSNFAMTNVQSLWTFVSVVSYVADILDTLGTVYGKTCWEVHHSIQHLCYPLAFVRSLYSDIYLISLISVCESAFLCLLNMTAFFQPDQPIYSAQYVRIRLGHSIEPSRSRSIVNKASQCIPAEEFLWMYESPKFSMEQVDSIQVFKLPHPVLCIGGVLQVELLGRVQTQAIDQLYYIW
jgi:hypothetical protein